MASIKSPLYTDASLNRALVLATLGIGLLCVTDAMVKWVAPLYSVIQIAFLRYLFGTAGALVIVAKSRPGRLSRETVHTNMVRALLVTATTLTFFYALSTLPFAETVAISFLSPLFIVLMGKLVLKEAIHRFTLVAIALGVVGTAVILGNKIGTEQYHEHALLGALAAIASALFYASNMIFLRARATRDSMASIVFFQNFGPTLILLLPVLYFWTPPSQADLLLFVALGLVGVLSHLLLSLAYSAAEAGKLAFVEYTALLWAALFGFLIFGEKLDNSIWIGAALIVAGALITARK
ncbi:DMT family transporter [Burkholderia gladioli]|uniref:DMT family transporter n=1 Tax=Burkholderia gladioli TaxID=28095 RepID=UPI0022D29868|nr:DMT family transporter [Burkholderia gladioli]MDA0574076.1 DMT family transporter [Burkholderia gladioli]MDA0602355.1 DMT family transporter [Burkholderia gladioli]